MKSLALAAISTVTAQNTTSFCDKYTTALFTNNTAENQLMLLTAVVNTAVIGNYSESKAGKAVSGILAKGTYEGVEVHLLPYFNGSLLQCSMQGNSAYPAYSGDASQYGVHKFMNLDPNEVGYFITQVADAAMSFGVSADDLAPVGMALNSLFGYRCAPATTVIPAQGAQLQSICQAEECPIAPNSTCDGVPESVEPAKAGGDNATA